MQKPGNLVLVQSLSYSVFHYCYPAYGNSISREDIERIQKIKNTTITFVYGLLIECSLSKIARCSKFATIGSSMYDTDSQFSPQDPYLRRASITICERLQFREEVTLCNMRQDRMFHFPSIALEYGKRQFFYFRPQFYKDLLESLKHFVLK